MLINYVYVFKKKKKRKKKEKLCNCLSWTTWQTLVPFHFRRAGAGGPGDRRLIEGLRFVVEELRAVKHWIIIIIHRVYTHTHTQSLLSYGTVQVSKKLFETLPFSVCQIKLFLNAVSCLTFSIWMFSSAI